MWSGVKPLWGWEKAVQHTHANTQTSTHIMLQTVKPATLVKVNTDLEFYSGLHRPIAYVQSHSIRQRHIQLYTVTLTPDFSHRGRKSPFIEASNMGPMVCWQLKGIKFSIPYELLCALKYNSLCINYSFICQTRIYQTHALFTTVYEFNRNYLNVIIVNLSHLIYNILINLLC